MKKSIFLICFLIPAYLVNGQDGNPQSSTSPKHHSSKKVKRNVSNDKVHYGTASFYANKFHGRKTANGEIFSQQKLTAACNTINMNTWVKVTNLRNKKTVVVKINDRMHPKNKRLIDLSHAAAKQLGYTGHGLAKVKVEVLGNHKPAGWTSLP